MKISTFLNPKDKSFWIKSYVIWILLIYVLHQVLRNWRYQIYFDMDNYWPISIFLPKYLVFSDWIIILGIAVLITWLIKNFEPTNLKLKHVLIVITVLIIATNGLQGLKEGFGTAFGEPDGGYVNYYHDTFGISSGLDLMRTFTAIQPTLRDHPRVHPPGALLYYYYLRHVPLPYFITFITFIIGMMTFPITYYFVKERANHEKAIFITMILGLIPGIQVYLLSSFDAVIMTFFWLSFVLFTKVDKSPKIFGLTVISLWLSTFFTFGALWLILVLGLYSFFSRKSLKYFFGIIGGIIMIYGLIYWLTSFQYLTSLHVATTFEGPPGFYPFVAPLSYLFTRIENILEIVIFFSFPLSTLIIWHIVNNFRKLKEEWPSIYAFGGFIAFITAGAYYTGETGRAASFVYPFLMMGILGYVVKYKPDLKWQKTCLFFVILQSVIMQAFGWYAW